DQCAACNLPGKEGTCTAVSGFPRNGRAACPASGACASFCDGVNTACTAATGTKCGDAYCSNGYSIPAATCTATACLPGAAVACSPFQCAPSGECLTDCVTDDDCAPGLICDGSECVTPPNVPDAGPPDASMGGTGGTGGTKATGGTTSTGGAKATGGTANTG